MSGHWFNPQPVRVRPHHFETPHSYLDRLCAVNVIDRGLIETAILSRKRASKRTHEIGLVIHELGGPGIGHFVRSYGRLSAKEGLDLLDEAFHRRKHPRRACAFCTAGEVVETYHHRRFNVCTKHGRWVAPHSGDEHPQRQVPRDARWMTAERDYRKAALCAYPVQPLVEGTWRAVRDQADLLGPADWRSRLDSARTKTGFVEGLDDRIALYPETARILRALGESDFWYVLDDLTEHPKTLDAYLRRKLRWIDGDTWPLVEGITSEAVRLRRDPRKAVVIRDTMIAEIAAAVAAERITDARSPG